MWPNIVKESKQLLGALGVPYMSAPASAESQCAQLVKNKVVHFSNSQDFDSILFGCPRVVQNLSKSLKRKVQGRWKYQKITPLTIDLKENLKRLEIDQFQLVDMALMIGTDYFPGIKKIGPKHAYKFIKKHRFIENVIVAEKENYDFSALSSEVIANVRKIFLLPEVLMEYPNLSWNYPSEHQTLSLLCEDHHLNRERVESNLKKLATNYEKCRTFFSNKTINSQKKQETLDSIF
jgi:flap endonuclease-1